MSLWHAAILYADWPNETGVPLPEARLATLKQFRAYTPEGRQRYIRLARNFVEAYQQSPNVEEIHEAMSWRIQDGDVEVSQSDVQWFAQRWRKYLREDNVTNQTFWF